MGRHAASSKAVKAEWGVRFTTQRFAQPGSSQSPVQVHACIALEMVFIHQVHACIALEMVFLQQGHACIVSERVIIHQVHA